MKEKEVSPVFVVVAVVFVSGLLMANILANRMISVGNWVLDAGVLTFPITYMLSDIVSEVYGYRWSRRLSLLSATMNLLLASLISLAIIIPHPEWFEGVHFELALKGSVRIVLASLVSFVVGDWIDDIIFEKMRKKDTNGTKFKTRAIISSIGGTIIDKILFIIIAFSFIVPFQEVIPMIVIGVVSQTMYEMMALPLTQRLLNFIKQKELQYNESTGVI